MDKLFNPPHLTFWGKVIKFQHVREREFKSDLTSRALEFALRAHEGQVRKGDGKPYIIHPVGVALIVTQFSTEDTIVAAALLHDTVEDTQTTIEDIQKNFGSDVAKIVSDVTEHDKSLPWRERKELAIAHVSEMDPASLIVKTADKVNNLESLYALIWKEGLDVMKKFNAPLNLQVEMDKKLQDELRKKWPGNPLLARLDQAVRNLELASLSDSELVRRFNSDVGNPGWVAARARFHSALRAELTRREIDFSSIGDEKSLSFRRKVTLKGKTLEPQI